MAVDLTDIPNKVFELMPLCDDNLKPSIGRLFDSPQEFEHFYKTYAHNIGFSVRSSTATKNKKGELQYKYFVCSKEGFKIEKTTLLSTDKGKEVARKKSNTRVGCHASAGVKKTNDGKFKIFTFCEAHNHELCTPKKRHFLKSNRKIADVQKNLLNSLDRVNVGPSKAFHIMKEQVGGYQNIGFTVKDAMNYARDLKALTKDSDAHMFIQNFKLLQNRNPSFFYAYELDTEDHLKHVFWCDGISRNNFSIFGDLLSFDTTYNTNKYSMIFAPFTGVNQHRLSITFGAALLADEKSETFTWLFEKFIECMGGNVPTLIVTDQDPAIKCAIGNCFTKSKHRFCMWHIMKKFSEKIGSALNANKEFQRRFKSCIWSSETPDEFEAEWNSIILDFGLSSNSWLLHMYELRTMWIPAYLKDIALSGVMRTTSRSESENSFFSTFVNNNLGLVEFYSRFENAMESQREKELKASHDSSNSNPELKTNLALERHASVVYTRENFYIFQEELWASCMSCGVKRSKEINTENDSWIFTIIENNGLNDKCRDVFYSSTDITCSCKMFESYGIPCRHMILVLKGQGTNELPSFVIINRWTKKATSNPVFDLNTNVLADISESERRRRLITNAWTQLHRCMEIAKLSDERLLDFTNYAQNWEKRMCEENECSRNNSNILSLNPNEIEIFPPKNAKTKGSGRRLKGGMEKAMESQQKVRRLCRRCGEYALHDSRNCPKKSTT